MIPKKNSSSLIPELAISNGLENSTRIIREDSQMTEIPKKNPISSLSVHMSGSVQQSEGNT